MVIPANASASCDAHVKLDGLAAYVRGIYLFYRAMAAGPTAAQLGDQLIPAWDGGRDIFGRHHDPVWPMLTRFLVDSELDPSEYIKHRLVIVRDPVARESPLALINPELAGSTQICDAELKEHLLGKLIRQIRSVELRMFELRSARGTEESQTITVLCDHQNVHADALARYCIASQMQLPRVADIYYQQALQIYVFRQRQFNTFWPHQTIPVSLKCQATTLVAAMPAWVQSRSTH